MERIFGGRGMGTGMGGMIGGSIFGSLVAGFVGSMIAEEFFNSIGDLDFGESASARVAQVRSWGKSSQRTVQLMTPAIKSLMIPMDTLAIWEGTSVAIGTEEIGVGETSAEVTGSLLLTLPTDERRSVL